MKLRRCIPRTEIAFPSIRAHAFWPLVLAAALLPTLSLQAQVQVAGTLYVDLRATHPSAGLAIWTNQGTLGNFNAIGAPVFTADVAASGIPGVFFDGLTNNAYEGPNSVADIEAGSNRSIEVWAYNPSLISEETTVSWGHRMSTRRDMAFNFGNNATWGAATHWGDDVSWGATPPTAGAWHHLVYTYSNPVVRVYIDGVLANSKTLAGALNTFAGEPINLACQRETALGDRSLPYSGYLNAVRIHGGVLSSSQILSNYVFGPAGGTTNPPAVPAGLTASAGYNTVWLEWNASAGADRYIVRRATSSGGPYTTLATNITTSYLSTGLAPGTNYYYVVAAGNFHGDSTNSNPISVTPGLPSQPVAAGTVYVDLRATNSSAGSATWINQGTLGNFSSIGAPMLMSDVAGTGIPGVLFDGGTDAYLGPNSVADIDGGSDRSVEVWAYNPSLVEEETTVSWGHRGTTRRDMAFNFGNNALYGAATHWNDDVGWAAGVPSAASWHHLVYTYENNVAKVYVDGVQVNVKNLAGALNTFAGEPINLACQREANGVRSLLYGGYLNAVRIHGEVLNAAEIQANYYFGPVAPPNDAVNDAITLNPGATALIPVLANDTVGSLFPVTVQILSGPGFGTAQVQSGDKVLYTHDASPSVGDQFTYTIRDSFGRTSDVATVSLTLLAGLRLPNTTMTVPNSPPVAAYEAVDAFPGNLFFEDVVALRSPPGSSNQLFAVERRGIISYIPDVTSPTPVRLVFVDLRNQTQFEDTAEGESGMMSMAFHPGFATNGIFFVNYLSPITQWPATGWATNSYARVSRFVANPNTLTVDTNTQQILINLKDDGDPCNCVNNHNGGDMHFGPDGYLYIGTGDEGGQFNVRDNAQRIDKDFYSGLLRIDVDRKPGSIEPKPHPAIPVDGFGNAFYSIPPGNPFVGATSFLGSPINTNTLRAEFFAVGIRHVWRFSIDTNGEIWAGDVGQNSYEEVNIITNGGNYGWSYYEGDTVAKTLYPTQNTLLSNPPPSFVHSTALWVYPHTGLPGGDPQYKGNSISGGLVYRGNRIPELNGHYIVGDFESSHIWALIRTNSSVVVQRIAGDIGVAGFGTDPSNGDVLIANYAENKIKRLVRTDASSSGFPLTLSDTGIFADLATLTPNPGIVNYDPIVAFWSDYAVKRRWFTIPDLTNTMTFAVDSNWTFPTGMKWIKHFDLETERGNPATKRRLETRVLVKTDSGTYGVSYQWNEEQDEAYLVGDGGTNFTVAVQDGTNLIQQQWEIPSRSACLACHTVVGGHALSFNTRELNQATNMNGLPGNQLTLLSQAGYFASPVANVHTLPAFARASDTNYSLEYRVRSYLAENCVQCHQPGGAGTPTWDARPHLTLAQTHLINGQAQIDGGDPNNKLIVPGNTNNSVLLRRIKGDGFSRMPPIGTHQLDQGAINLLTEWITTELTNHLTFAQWQIANFGSTNNPIAAANADPDGDGANNYNEFLTGTGPQNVLQVWRLGVSASGGWVNVTYPQVPNLGVVIETGTNLFNWTPWNVPGNEPFFGSWPATVFLQGPLSMPTNQFFRARLIEP